jgi:nucleoside-diphosphate-sugar epimerase
MKVLVIGGSGYLGGLTLPVLAQHHDISVFDLRPPAQGPWNYLQADVADLSALNRAMDGAEALIYMAMGSTDKDGSCKSVRASETAFDITVKGLYFALDAAHHAGCMHAVYTSSMSIYHGPVEQRFFENEDMTPDAHTVYGLTKHLGEEVCRYAVRSWGMSINSLRLCFPVSMQSWSASNNKLPVCATANEDTVRAILAALEYRKGFEAFMISGDHNEENMVLSKARNLLNLEPLTRPNKTSWPVWPKIRRKLS